ncbi:MAG: glucose 1-dehydrogenase [Actinomycetota bacterium]
MSGRLEGKTALITGAAMGMGAAHARAFIAEGAQVLIADMAKDQGQALADELGEKAAFVELNVTESMSWANAVETTLERFGKLDTLVNNAGIFTTGSLEDYSEETWDETLAVNLKGAFLGMKAAVTHLAAASPGSIINISSTAGIEGYTKQLGYSASKWGLRGLTRSAALELADRGIRVNSVHPGAVATPLIEQFKQISDSDFEGSTLKRFARPEEISGLLVFLASDEASFVTGSEYVIDGGITAGTMF